MDLTLFIERAKCMFSGERGCKMRISFKETGGFKRRNAKFTKGKQKTPTR